MANEKVKQLTEETFEAEIMNSNKISMVDFWADWCGPCKMMGPVIDNLAEKYGNKENIVIGKINVDENPSIARKFRVMSIPTMLFFKDGKEVERLVGVQNIDVLEAHLEANS